MTLEDFKKKLRKMTLTKSKELKLRLEYEKKILTGFSKQGVYAEKV
jgi:hypothetical protein